MTIEVRIGPVTVSDRSSRSVYVGRRGPAMFEHPNQRVEAPWNPIVRVIHHERPLIESALIELYDAERCGLIVATEGTGPSPKDVTAQATEQGHVQSRFWMPSRSSVRSGCRACWRVAAAMLTVRLAA